MLFLALVVVTLFVKTICTSTVDSTLLFCQPCECALETTNTKNRTLRSDCGILALLPWAQYCPSVPTERFDGIA